MSREEAALVEKTRKEAQDKSLTLEIAEQIPDADQAIRDRYLRDFRNRELESLKKAKEIADTGARVICSTNAACGSFEAITGKVGASTKGEELGITERFNPIRKLPIKVKKKQGNKSNKKWNDPINVNGRKVYQRDDLFKSNTISTWKVKGKTVSGTNIKRMRSGRAPIGKDGNPIELHHLTQTENNKFKGNGKGSLAEVASIFHKKNTKILHIPAQRNPNNKRQTLPRFPSFRKDNKGNSTDAAKQFDKYTKEYWKTRAKGF